MADNSTLPANGDVIRDIDRSGVKTQVMALDVGGAGAELLASATNPLPTSLNASIFRFSTNNSTSAELAVNATYTGTVETALDQPSISILMTSDQPMIVTIFQYIDISGVYAVTPIIYNTLANQGLSASFPLNGNYVKLTAKNVGTATTTTFELNTAYGNLPSSDGTGSTPVSQADCVPVLTQTLTAIGTSNVIDTRGYGAIVAQLSGVWQGSCYFESSNTGTDWDTVLVFSRDNLSLQDIITQCGLFTVRPSGRYLRLTMTNVTGALIVTALGRAAEGIAASDLLSLAMDKANNTPLNVQLNGVKQDVAGALFLSDAAGPFTAVATTASTTIPVLTIETTGYQSLVMTGVWGTGVAQVAFAESLAGPWTLPSGVAYLNSNNVPISSYQGNMSFTSGLSGMAQFPILGRYARVLLTTVTLGPANVSVTLRAVPCYAPAPLFSTNGTLNCNIATGTVTATATQPFTPTTLLVASAATTNATSVKASAGTIYSINCSNVGAAAVFVKLHNSAAAPTVGSTAVTYTIAIPANSNAFFDGGVLGIRYGTGIAFSITNLIADTDATAIAANQVKLNISYI